MGWHLRSGFWTLTDLKYETPDTTYLDQNGEYSDWIELYNGGISNQEITGWFLTDDANDLTKWAFPTSTVPGGGYLLVIASSSNADLLRSMARIAKPLNSDFPWADCKRYRASSAFSVRPWISSKSTNLEDL